MYNNNLYKKYRPFTARRKTKLRDLSIGNHLNQRASAAAAVIVAGAGVRFGAIYSVAASCCFCRQIGSKGDTDFELLLARRWWFCGSSWDFRKIAGVLQVVVDRPDLVQQSLGVPVGRPVDHRRGLDAVIAAKFANLH